MIDVTHKSIKKKPDRMNIMNNVDKINTINNMNLTNTLILNTINIIKHIQRL